MVYLLTIRNVKIDSKGFYRYLQRFYVWDSWSDRESGELRLENNEIANKLNGHLHHLHWRVYNPHPRNSCTLGIRRRGRGRTVECYNHQTNDTEQMDCGQTSSQVPRQFIFGLNKSGWWDLLVLIFIKFPWYGESSIKLERSKYSSLIQITKGKARNSGPNSSTPAT